MRIFYESKDVSGVRRWVYKGFAFLFAAMFVVQLYLSGYRSPQKINSLVMFAGFFLFYGAPFLLKSKQWRSAIQSLGMVLFATSAALEFYWGIVAGWMAGGHG